VNSFSLSLVESGLTRITTSSFDTLDRFIVSDMDRVRELSIVTVSSVADHELVILDLDYVRTVEKPIIRYFGSFCHMELPVLEAELSAMYSGSQYPKNRRTKISVPSYIN
jgi:hypothetical protein